MSKPSQLFFLHTKAKSIGQQNNVATQQIVCATIQHCIRQNSGTAQVNESTGKSDTENQEYW